MTPVLTDLPTGTVTYQTRCQCNADRTWHSRPHPDAATAYLELLTHPCPPTKPQTIHKGRIHPPAAPQSLNGHNPAPNTTQPTHQPTAASQSLLWVTTLALLIRLIILWRQHRRRRRP